MNSPETAKRHHELAAKWLAGEITEAEEQELAAYFKQEDLGDLYIPRKFKNSEQNYRDSLYRRIQTKLGLHNNSTYRIWTWSAAAAILIAIGVLINLQINTPIENVAHHPHPKTARPSSNPSVPVLILEDGSEINLSQTKEGTVSQQNGVAITKNEKGQLVYSFNKTPSNNINQNIVYHKIKTPVGQQFVVSLSDGTKVWLNAGSSLKFPIQFTQKERAVDLVGEAYFEVAKNRAKPFKVNTATQQVEVLGTHFNINAYENESLVKTTLLEGSVKVKGKEEGYHVMLKPGQQSVAMSNKLKVIEADIESVIAWKNGYFKFDNEDVEGIMRKLSRWYNIDVVFETEKNPNLIFAGRISQSKSISSVLKIIEETGSVHFKISGRRVTLIK